LDILDKGKWIMIRVTKPDGSVVDMSEADVVAELSKFDDAAYVVVTTKKKIARYSVKFVKNWLTKTSHIVTEVDLTPAAPISPFARPSHPTSPPATGGGLSQAQIAQIVRDELHRAGVGVTTPPPPTTVSPKTTTPVNTPTVDKVDWANMLTWPLGCQAGLVIAVIIVIFSFAVQSGWIQ
jgi:hypothetical protein